MTQKESEKFPPINQYCGGSGGIAFDDGANKRIVEINVKSGGIIDSISLGYADGSYVTHGGEGGYEEQRMDFHSDEYVIEATVYMCYFSKDHIYMVHGLTFKTNFDRLMGPCGKEEGWDKPGWSYKEVTMAAPKGYGLKGIFGRKGEYLDGIGFHWCDISNEAM